MTTTDMLSIKGKFHSWDVISGEFTLGTLNGGVKINVQKCDEEVLDAMIDAMKNRRTIEIRVVDE